MIVGVLGFALVSTARADEFHHKNILIGERAAGLAGAFTAMSDDPSGIYYNPAGLAFIFENYISLSANAWNSTRTVFKNVVDGRNYLLSSNALVPSFFGFTQAIGKSRLAFAVIVPNSDLVDQNDLLDGFTTSTGQNYLSRRYYKIDNTYMIGPAMGFEIADNLSFGISLFGNFRVMKSIDNQMGKFTDDGYFFQNVYSNLFSTILTPKIGFQYMPMPKLSLGVSTSFDVWSTGTVSQKLVFTPTVAGTDPVEYVTQNGLFANDVRETELQGAGSFSKFSKTSVGVAYFFSKNFLMTSDLDLILPISSPSHKFTWNAAMGMEYYLNDGNPVRLGYTTNNSSVSSAGLGGEATSANIHTLTSGVSWVGGGSSFTLGLSYGMGSGQGKITKARQDVSVTQYSVFLQGSYQL